MRIILFLLGAVFLAYFFTKGVMQVMAQRRRKITKKTSAHRDDFDNNLR